MEFNVKFELSDQTFPVKFDNIQTATKLVGGEQYNGPLEVTPTREQQTLPTSGKVLGENVVVHPIPKEYGLVSYDNRKIIKIT